MEMKQRFDEAELHKQQSVVRLQEMTQQYEEKYVELNTQIKCLEKSLTDRTDEIQE